MANRPNIIFMFSDQQRYDTLACYGNDSMEVPNLNALADQSFVFKNAYVAQAVCTPARATIMTGLFRECLPMSSIHQTHAEAEHRYPDAICPCIP